MLECITTEQFNEWIGFYGVEPFGEEWRQTSYVCTMIGNSQGGRGKGKPFRPEDFMPVEAPATDEEKTGGQMMSDIKKWESLAKNPKRKA